MCDGSCLESALLFLAARRPIDQERRVPVPDSFGTWISISSLDVISPVVCLDLPSDLTLTDLAYCATMQAHVCKPDDTCRLLI